MGQRETLIAVEQALRLTQVENPGLPVENHGEETGVARQPPQLAGGDRDTGIERGCAGTGGQSGLLDGDHDGRVRGAVSGEPVCRQMLHQIAEGPPHPVRVGQLSG